MSNFNPYAEMAAAIAAEDAQKLKRAKVAHDPVIITIDRSTHKQMIIVHNAYSFSYIDEEAADDDKCQDCWKVRPSRCARCANIHQRAYRDTFNGFITHIASSARSSAVSRGKKDIARGESNAWSTCTITKEHLLALLKTQDNKCYYSGIPLVFRRFNDWQCSLEIIDPSQGYVPENIALCCLEFNFSYQWTTSKIKSILGLIRDTPVDIETLTKLVNEARVKPDTHKLMCKLVTLQPFQCSKCLIIKSEKDFYSYVNKQRSNKLCTYKVCKSCRTSLQTLREFIKERLRASQRKAKERSGRGDSSGDHSLTLDMVFDKIISQKGRCAYSGIPLVFKRNADWMLSIERIDNCNGYTDVNTVLICTEFNVGSCPADTKYADVKGSSQWNKAKFEYFLSYLKKQTNDAALKISDSFEVDTARFTSETEITSRKRKFDNES
jgi:hypothetical protein